MKKREKITPTEAIEFLDYIYQIASNINKPTMAISIRIPENILRAVKLKAKADGKKYQSLIVSYIRKGLMETK